MTARAPAEPAPPDLAGTPLAAPASGEPRPTGRRAPWWLWVLAVGVLVPVVVPVAALFIRTFSAADTAAKVIFSPRTLELVIRSAVLTVLVTATATAIGIAVAWLTTRSDLRGRRTWAVLGDHAPGDPLVRAGSGVPCGGRATGHHRRSHSHRVSNPGGSARRLARVDALHVPVRAPHRCRRTATGRSCSGRSRPRSRGIELEGVPNDHAAPVASRDRGGVLCSLRSTPSPDFGAVSLASLRFVHSCDLCPVPGKDRSNPGRGYCRSC